MFFCVFFFASRRRHTRCALVTGVQTCALPIFDSGAHYACDEGDNALPLTMPGTELRITDGFAFLQRERRATQLMADLLAFRDLLENSDGNIAIQPAIAALFTDQSRSEERRVGTGCVSTGRSWW